MIQATWAEEDYFGVFIGRNRLHRAEGQEPLNKALLNRQVTDPKQFNLDNLTVEDAMRDAKPLAGQVVMNRPSPDATSS